MLKLIECNSNNYEKVLMRYDISKTERKDSKRRKFVSDIINNVKKNKIRYLLNYCKEFDQCSFENQKYLLVLKRNTEKSVQKIS